MDKVIAAAKRVLVKLSEIQPALSMCGMDYESAVVAESKKDLAQVIFSITPDPVVVERGLDAQFTDVMESMDYFLATLEGLGKLDRGQLRSSKRFASLLQLARVSAENFAARTEAYLSSKESYQQLFGGENATN